MQDAPPAKPLELLRELLHEPPSEEAWRAICAFFDAWPSRDPDRAIGIDYARAHLDMSWPDALRVPPRSWRFHARKGAPPPAWAITRPFDVHLAACGPRRMGVIQALREALGVGLRDAIELVTRTPQQLSALVGLREAQHLAEALRNAGAQVSVIAANPLHDDSATIDQAGFGVRLLGTGQLDRVLGVRALRRRMHTLSLNDALLAFDRAPWTLPGRDTLTHVQGIANELERAGLEVDVCRHPPGDGAIAADPAVFGITPTRLLRGDDARALLDATAHVAWGTHALAEHAHNAPLHCAPTQAVLRGARWAPTRALVRDLRTTGFEVRIAHTGPSTRAYNTRWTVSVAPHTAPLSADQRAALARFLHDLLDRDSSALTRWLQHPHLPAFETEALANACCARLRDCGLDGHARPLDAPGVKARP